MGKGFKAGFIGMMLVLTIGLGGCCGGGSTTKNKSTTTTTTLGDELNALKDAYDRGSMTEQEYNAAKEKLIKQRTENQ